MNLPENPRVYVIHPSVKYRNQLKEAFEYQGLETSTVPPTQVDEIQVRNSDLSIVSESLLPMELLSGQPYIVVGKPVNEAQCSERAIQHLDDGAANYLSENAKPNLIVSVSKAIMRRGKEVSLKPILTVNNFELNPNSREVKKHGQLIELARIEFDLLAFFMNKPGICFSKDQLLSNLWGYSKDTQGDGTLIRVYVQRLRAKLGQEAIVTLRGKGYKFADKPILSQDR